MKIMNVVRLALLSLVAIFMQSVDCKTIGKSPVETVQKVAATTAQVEQENMGELAVAFAESKVIIGKATEAMNNARELLLRKDTTQADDLRNVKTIIEQNKIIVLAQQKLEKMRDDIAKKVEKEVVEQGYWNRFVTGVKNVGSNIASFFIRTEEEKATARLIAKGLTEQEVKITEKYALLQKNLEDAQKAQLKDRYDAIIAPMEAAIYEQQLITGDAKSSMIKRGLLLGAAAAGTVAGGMMLKNKYFGQEGEEGEEEDWENVPVPTLSDIRTAFKESGIPEKITEAARKTDVSKAIREGYEEKTAPTVSQLWEVAKSGAKTAAGKAKEYFGRSGGPAEKSEDIQGVTLEDLLAVKEYIVDRISKALKVDSEVAERLAEERGLLEGLAFEDYREGLRLLKEAAKETSLARAIQDFKNRKAIPSLKDIKEALPTREEAWNLFKEKASQLPKYDPNRDYLGEAKEKAADLRDRASRYFKGSESSMNEEEMQNANTEKSTAPELYFD